MKTLFALALISASLAAAADGPATRVDSAYLCKMPDQQTVGLTVYTNDTIAINTADGDTLNKLIVLDYNSHGIYTQIRTPRGVVLGKATFRDATASFNFTNGKPGDCRALSLGS